MKFKTALKLKSLKWHKTLGWTGGVALLIFGISGLLHPVMTWSGPQQVAFFPPSGTLQGNEIAHIPSILRQNDIDRAMVVKAIPGDGGALLQVTQDPMQPRRYFDLETGGELSGHDMRQAVFLARYYTGLETAEIVSVDFQTQFDAAYPWVNRLLPVYRVTFGTEDPTTAFIYTETATLANLTNRWKTQVQSVFGALHTWNWLENAQTARVALMLVLLVSLFGMAATGTALVFTLASRRIPDKKRRLHRLVAYAVWMPLLCFSASGAWHLLQHAYGAHRAGLQTGSPMKLDAEKLSQDGAWMARYQGMELNGISLVQGQNGALLYRFGIPQGKTGENITREARFDGMPMEKPAVYVDAATGAEMAVTDRDMALFHAGKRTLLPESIVSHAEIITRFGPDYDFRNKRLPVWRVDYGTPQGDRVFIDPVTGMLVDRVADAARYESMVFSALHKWNMLVPVLGRGGRDGLVVIIISASLFFTVLGFMLLLSRKNTSRNGR